MKTKTEEPWTPKRLMHICESKEVDWACEALNACSGMTNPKLSIGNLKLVLKLATMAIKLRDAWVDAPGESAYSKARTNLRTALIEMGYYKPAKRG